MLNRKSIIAFAASVALFASAAVSFAQDTIKIGHYGSLTGSEATFGLSTSQGVRLAISELNAAGGINGKKVVLVEYDDKGDAKEAGAVVTRLVSSDHVAAVIGEVASGLSLAGGPICQKAQIPMISPSSTNPRVTEGKDFVYRVCFIDPFQGYVAAKFATKTKGAKRIAILLDQSQAYAVGLADSFVKNFKEMGGEITTSQSYNGGDQDFNARLTAIRATNPDMIYVPGYYTDVANIAIQARKLGIKVPLLGGDGWDSAKLTEIGGQSIEGSFFSNHAAPDEPAMVAFAQKYSDEYGSQPDALAALGYDAANLVFDAMKRAKSTSGPDLRDALTATPGFQGVTGTIKFDENRNPVKDAVVVELKGGKPVLAERIKPEMK